MPPMATSGIENQKILFIPGAVSNAANAKIQPGDLP